MQPETLKMIYNDIFHSIANYDILALRPCNNSTLLHLQYTKKGFQIEYLKKT